MALWKIVNEMLSCRKWVSLYNAELQREAYRFQSSFNFS